MTAKHSGAMSIFLLLVTGFVYGQGSMPKVKIPFGHTERINIMQISPNGKYIITGSDDKTAIIWDARTGKEIRTLSAKFAVQDLQITPDSKQVIIAAGSGMRVKGGLIFSLWDISTGKLLREFPFYGGTGFAFLPGNNMLLVPNYSTVAQEKDVFTTAMASDRANAATYDIRNNKVLKSFPVAVNWNHSSGTAEKTELKIVNGQNNTYLITASGKLFTMREGGEYALHIWNMNDDSKPERSVSFNDPVKNIASSITGGIFATSSKNKILIWNTVSALPIDSFVPVAKSIKKIELSPDGKQLFCHSLTNSNKTTRGESVLQQWDIASRREVLSFNIPPGVKTDELKIAPDGRYFIVLKKKGEEVIVYDNSGNQMYNLFGHVVDSKRMFFSENNRFLAPRTLSGNEAKGMFSQMNAMMELAKGMLGEDTSLKRKLDESMGNAIKKLPIDTKNGNYSNFSLPAFDLYTGTGFRAPRFNSELVYKGIRLQMTKDTSSKDRNLVLLNNETRPSAYEDLDIVAGDKNAAKMPYDPRLVTGFLNQVEPKSKVKFIINKTSRDTLSLIYLDSTEWILLSSKGYYKCSNKAASYLYYVTNDNNIISFEQLDLKYNRPDLVLMALGSTDKALVEAYRKSYDSRLARYNMDINAFGSDNIMPEADFPDRDRTTYNQSKEKMQLRVSAGSAKSALRRFNVWINEVPVFGSKGIVISRRPGQAFDTSISIILSEGKNKIEASVFDAAGYESYRYPLFVNYNTATPRKPRTWFVGIGVNKYADPQHNTLKYTIEDIRSVVSGLQQKAAGGILVDTLFNNNFTLAGLEKIKTKLSGAAINDKVIIMYSGHGVLGKDGKYYFPVSTMTAQDFTDPGARSISYEVVESLLDGIPARNKLLLLDACHSGVYDPGTETVLDSTTTSQLMDDLFTYVGRGTGATIIASSCGQANSLESPALRHGFFTQSILDALAGFENITVSELKNHIINRVPFLSEAKQLPTIRSENREADFRIW